MHPPPQPSGLASHAIGPIGNMSHCHMLFKAGLRRLPTRHCRHRNSWGGTGINAPICHNTGLGTNTGSRNVNTTTRPIQWKGSAPRNLLGLEPTFIFPVALTRSLTFRRPDAEPLPEPGCGFSVATPLGVDLPFTSAWTLSKGLSTGAECGCGCDCGCDCDCDCD